DDSLDLVGGIAEVAIGVGDLQVHALAQHNALQRFLEGPVHHLDDGVAEYRDLANDRPVELLVGRVGVDVGDLDLVVAADLELAVAGHRLAQRGQDRAEDDTNIAADGMALDDFLVALRGDRLDLDGLARFQGGEVGVFNLDEEALAGLDLLDLAFLAGEHGA